MTLSMVVPDSVTAIMSQARSEGGGEGRQKWKLARNECDRPATKQHRSRYTFAARAIMVVSSGRPIPTRCRPSQRLRRSLAGSVSSNPRICATPASMTPIPSKPNVRAGLVVAAARASRGSRPIRVSSLPRCVCAARSQHRRPYVGRAPGDIAAHRGVDSEALHFDDSARYVSVGPGSGLIVSCSPGLCVHRRAFPRLRGKSTRLSAISRGSRARTPEVEPGSAWGSVLPVPVPGFGRSA